jgi:CPA2 family monovalent cation:H+ antiporter-2
MDELAIPLLVVFAGIVLIPPLARKTGLPVIVVEIIFGMLIGRSLFNLIPDHEIIEFFSSFGLAYLMFLGGIETDFAKLTNRALKQALMVVAVSIAVPFVTGFLLADWVGVNRFLLGTIFCTTSLGLTLPLLKSSQFRPRFARILLTSVVLVDIVSLFLLAFVMSGVQGSITADYSYSFLIILALFFLPWLIRKRKLRRKITLKLSKDSLFDIEVRLAFALIFILAAISAQLGFHAIIGGFIAGLIASEVLPRKILREEKLQSFGYGFFIPMFFIFTGARVNLPGVFADVSNLIVLIVIVAAGILSKIIGVGVVAKFTGLKIRESITLGLLHSGRLSLIIAAADISIRLGLISENLFAMLIILAVVSATMAPALGRRVLRPAVKS